MTLIEDLKRAGACRQGVQAVRDLHPEEYGRLIRAYEARKVVLNEIPESLRADLSWAMKFLGAGSLAKDQRGTQIPSLYLAGGVEDFDFTGSKVEYIDLDAAFVTRFAFDDLQSKGVYFRSTNLVDASFRRLKSRKIDMEFSNLSSSSFWNADVGQFAAEYSRLSDLEFENALIQEFSLVHCLLQHSNFAFSDLSLDIFGGRIYNCDFRDSRLSGTFRGVQFDLCVWPEDLSRVEFVNCQGSPK